MSHMAKYTTKLTNVSPQLMRQVLNTLAQKYKGHMATHVTDYYNKQTAVDMALITPQFQRGIGVRITNGTLEFICDDYEHQQIVTELQQQVQQYYTATAAIQALQELGYEVQTSEMNGEFVLQGVKG